jgi:hypothetical protein
MRAMSLCPPRVMNAITRAESDRELISANETSA